MAEQNEKPTAEPADVEVVHADAAAAPHGELVLARTVFPHELPILPLPHRPLFPRMQVPLLIDNPALRRRLLADEPDRLRYLGLVLRRPEAPAGDDDTPVRGDQLYRVGVITEVLRVAAAPNDGPVQVLLGAHERMRIVDILQDEPFIRARVDYQFETEMAANEELKAYSLAVVKALKELIQLNPLHKEEMGLLMSQASLQEPGRLADFAAALTSADPKDLQEVLETLSIRQRLARTLTLLQKELDISRLQVKISKQIEEKLSRQQREFFLREQLKAIKKELGIEKETKDAEADRFEQRLKALTLSDEARERIGEELEKLRLIEPASPEFTVTRNYLDWLTSLPWGVFTEDRYDLARARKVLDRDHFGLEDVKERILEFLAVGALKGNISGSILCFVGPPGVGKTSIGRQFYRFSVGGIQDEAEIKGHRRTYIGALPGKCIQAMKACRSANPVIMLDEIDKIGQSYRGDPASALLEVLDPEQNRDFLDHYLDVRFDLSNVFFICTANQLDTIPRPLLDRMEVIKLAGYITEEKLEIAVRYLVPKQLAAHGLDRQRLTITRRALRAVVDGYAREPGVRNLENAIKKLIRKSARRLAAGDVERVRLDTPDVEALLGKRLFADDELAVRPPVGVVTGLAWTSMGGDTLSIEAAAVASGKGGFKQTGQLGSVMVESSEIAYTYARAYLSAQPEALKRLNEHFIHLHVPAGATPKDGPSAGITMACALVSLATGRPVRRALAMTGELTLTGRVMPIGGVKEKTIAAKRARIRHLVFPEGNRKDFDDLPAHIRRGLTPHFVKTFQDVADVAFGARNPA